MDLKINNQDFNVLADKLKHRYADYIVNKKLTRLPLLEDLPNYVKEFLINKYSITTDEITNADLRIILEFKERSTALKDAENKKYELFKEKEFELMGKFRVTVDLTKNKLFVQNTLINSPKIETTQKVVDLNPKLTKSGLWGLTKIIYYEENNKYKLKLIKFTPFQTAFVDIDEYIEGRENFTTEEWLKVLINTLGLNPKQYNSRYKKFLLLSRLIPLVESRTNFIELAPTGTGKSYLMENLSYTITVVPGGDVTIAQLFRNLNTKELGLFPTSDVVVFDEIKGIKFKDPLKMVSLLQSFLISGKSPKFPDMVSDCSLFLMGNLELDKHGNVADTNYFSIFPKYFRKEGAFFDRFSGFIYGWDLPKISYDKISLSQDYGFLADYFCEILQDLRKDQSFKPLIHERLKFFEGKIRDQTFLIKNASGLLKLIFPDKNFSDNEFKEVIYFSKQLRERINDGLNKIDPGNYPNVEIEIDFRE